MARARTDSGWRVATCRHALRCNKLCCAATCCRYVVMELMECHLGELIDPSNTPFSPAQVWLCRAPHLRWDWAHPPHICTGTGLTPAHIWLRSQVKGLMVQLCAAVAAMHECWVIHRDLKMPNLLMSADGVLKVCVCAPIHAPGVTYTRRNNVPPTRVSVA